MPYCDGGSLVLGLSPLHPPPPGWEGEKPEINSVKFPLLFEGGVAGTIDYLAFTIFTSRPGWLVSLLEILFFLLKSLLYPIHYKFRL